MATITFETNTAATVGTPTWTAFGANNVVFSGSPTSLTATIATTGWNDGTHRGTGTPGTDACGGVGPGGGGAHNNNVKFLTSSTMSLNGAGSAAITDTNLVQGACTFRVHLNNGVAVQTQNSMFYSFNGTTDAVPATDIECYAFERGVAATAWTLINNFSIAGQITSAQSGGNNVGQFLTIHEQTSGVDLFWYFAISATGESAGGKSAWALKLSTQIF